MLPAIDDGAANYRVAFRMLEQAVAQGITHVACTPHLNDRATPETDRHIQSVFFEFVEAVEKIGLPVSLMLGSEIMLGADLTRLLDLPVATYGGKGRYLLLEFPPTTPHDIALNVITTVRRRGKVPVLAHVERFTGAVRHKEHAEALREAGALLTLDGGSLFGQFGAAMTRRAESLVKEEVIDIIMSDAHDDERFMFCLKGAREAATAIVGPENARRMVLDHPKIVWDNDPWPGIES